MSRDRTIGSDAAAAAALLKSYIRHDGALYDNLRKQLANDADLALASFGDVVQKEYARDSGPEDAPQFAFLARQALLEVAERTLAGEKMPTSQRVVARLSSAGVQAHEAAAFRRFVDRLKDGALYLVDEFAETVEPLYSLPGKPRIGTPRSLAAVALIGAAARASNNGAHHQQRA